ncbi:MAG TPA: hypothetical protein VFU69_08190, partial [Ktedonobacterales bacterium]|nr:hypothetical protein [Ktedonobacterales bacterium]
SLLLVLNLRVRPGMARVVSGEKPKTRAALCLVCEIANFLEDKGAWRCFGEQASFQSKSGLYNQARGHLEGVGLA